MAEKWKVLRGVYAITLWFQRKISVCERCLCNTHLPSFPVMNDHIRFQINAFLETKERINAEDILLLRYRVLNRGPLWLKKAH
jgi:hypothetical protein